MTTETNAEWLERISKTDRYMYDRSGKHVTVSSEEFDFLVQQAERAQELEVSNNRCVQIALNRQRYIGNIDSENARLREEVEFYKNKLNFTRPDESGMGSRLSRREKGLQYD